MLTPYDDAAQFAEGITDLAGSLDDLTSQLGMGRPIDAVRERRQEWLDSLDPDARLDYDRGNPINRAKALGEAISDMRHGFGRNKDGQVCWFVSPHLSTGYAVCTPAPPPPSDPVQPPTPEPEPGDKPDIPLPITPMPPIDESKWLCPLKISNEGSETISSPNGNFQEVFGYSDVDLGQGYVADKRFYRNSQTTRQDYSDGGFFERKVKRWGNVYRCWRYRNGAFISTHEETNLSDTTTRYYRSDGGIWTLEKSSTLRVEVVWFTGDPCNLTEPQTPQPPPQEDIMQDECCQESLELLRLIARWTGANKIKAMELPNTILEPQAKDSPYAKVYADAFGEKETVTIDNLGELTIYLLTQISTLTGSFPFEIEIPPQIREASERGGEPLPEKLPIFSIRDGIENMLNFSINIQDDETRLADLLVRAIAESYMGRQSATLGYLYLKTLFEWFNIETTDKVTELPTLVTFPNPEKPPDTEDELLEFIKPSKIELKYPTLPKKGKDFSDLMYPVVEAAQMIRTKWGVRIPKGQEKNFTQELMLNWATMLGYDGAKTLIERYRKKQQNPNAPDDDKEDSLDDKEWREFTEMLEQGFSTQGIKRPDKPYGRDSNQRPRIRTINDSQDEVR
ncbi:hypothetical protein QQ056_09410 [Oscillatoria laete-virens NRMC-F 0139]|nr:hypothetical protein [Oscillatoria laete-virens NRMC-F 0139]